MFPKYTQRINKGTASQVRTDPGQPSETSRRPKRDHSLPGKGQVQSLIETGP